MFSRESAVCSVKEKTSEFIEHLRFSVAFHWSLKSLFVNDHWGDGNLTVLRWKLRMGVLEQLLTCILLMSTNALCSSHMHINNIASQQKGGLYIS